MKSEIPVNAMQAYELARLLWDEWSKHPSNLGRYDATTGGFVPDALSDLCQHFAAHVVFMHDHPEHVYICGEDDGKTETT